MRKGLLALAISASLVLPTGIGAANAHHKPGHNNPPPCRDHKCAPQQPGPGTVIVVPGTNITITVLGNNIINISGLPVTIGPILPGQTINLPGVIRVNTGTNQCSIAEVILEVTNPDVRVCIDGDPLSVSIT